MKYITTLLLSLIITASASAQKGFELMASAGTGWRNIKTNIRYIDRNGNLVWRSGIISYSFGIGLGYVYKNWRFQTGLQYLKTGYEMNNLLFGTDFDPQLSNFATGAGDLKITYGHLGVPLQVGYVLLPSGMLHLVPSIGMLTTYNMGARSAFGKGSITEYNWTSTFFEERYNRISIWGMAALYLESNTGSRVRIFCGPSFAVMASNFGNTLTTQRNYSINLDLGVKFRL